jgi:hypothetical protein
LSFHFHCASLGKATTLAATATSRATIGRAIRTTET